MRHTLMAAVAMGSVFATVRAASAAPVPPARGRWTLTDTLGASVNRAGVENALELAWTRGTATAGVTHVLSPAYTRVQCWAEITPVRVATLRVGAAPSAYFGTFQSLMGFQSLDDDFGDDVRDLRAPEARAATALLLYAQPTVRMAVGPVAAVASASLERWTASGDAPVFYEPSRDALVRRRGGALVTTTAALLLRGTRPGGGELAGGVVHKTTRVPDAGGNDAGRIGVFLTRGFGGRRMGLREPRLAANVLYALEDRYREGQVGAGVSVGFRLGPE